LTDTKEPKLAVSNELARVTCYLAMLHWVHLLRHLQMLPPLLPLLVLLMQLLSQATIPCNWPVLSLLTCSVTASIKIRSIAGVAKSLGHVAQQKLERIVKAVNFGRLPLEEREPCKLILGGLTSP